jgi:NAD(P)-dependent dehydrogenase (short-subunit alcohol dehydrogenase family)
MSTVLITGANRGLGLEFSRQYAQSEWAVIACCRKPEQAAQLKQLAAGSSIQIEALDVADFAQIDALSKKLTGQSLDILINNAGIYSDQRLTGFGCLDYQAWDMSFRVNVLAPVKMAEAFLGQLKRGDNKLIVSISSLMGSIADNGSGGSLLYRSSKAALNAAMKSLSIDLSRQGIGVLTLHPGWVKTDMGGANALINSEESVSGMRRLITDYRPDQSGGFYNYRGDRLPW